MTVFGTFDGLTSAVGLVFAAIITSADVVAVSFALAISAAVSMAAGEWLSDDQPKNKGRRALVMGVATFVGSLAPAIWFMFGVGSLSIALATLTVICLGVVIAELRPGARKPSYLKTFGVLAIASVLACGAALIGQVIAG